MKVQDTLVDCIRRYPSLYKTGGDVLHHLFCVIGNGYRWCDGELVPIDFDERAPYRDVLGIDVLPDEMLKGIPEWELQFIRERSAAQRGEEYKIAVEAVERAQNWGFEDVETFYPETPSAPLFNLPVDITPDWFEAAEYMKEQAVNHGWILKYS